MKNTKTLTSNNSKILNDYEMNLKIADAIIATIEAGDVQAWRRTWTTTLSKTTQNIYNLAINDQIAVNVYSMKQYNSILVPAGFYVTFKDIKDHGLHLIKGSKGVPSYRFTSFAKYMTKYEEEALYKYIEDKEELKEEIESLKSNSSKSLQVSFTYKDLQGQERSFDQIISWAKVCKKFTYKKTCYVLFYLFKASDCGLSNTDIAKLWNVSDDHAPLKSFSIDEIEAVKDSYIKRAKLLYHEEEQDRAYYRPSTHEVVIPARNQFNKIEDFYQVTLHEFAHSTGHQSLLNRKTLTSSCGFASVSYSKEELVAELSSLYSLISLNICTDEILKNSIAYLRSWGEHLKEGIKHNILNTINQSRKATNLILNIKEDKGATA